MKKAVLLVVALSFYGAANAGEQRPFDKLDVDGDGKLSKEEFLRTVKSENHEKMGKVFDNRDKDDDGFLTLDEYTIPAKKKSD
jgi:Ca2+-binding EF-hand superfamily protein